MYQFHWLFVVVRLHFSIRITIFEYFQGPDGSISQVVGIPNNSYKHITNTAWVRTRLCKSQKRVHSTAASDKVYRMLARDRWFSPGTPASSTTKSCCHDIAEILLKVALNTKYQMKSNLLITHRYPLVLVLQRFLKSLALQSFDLESMQVISEIRRAQYIRYHVFIDFYYSSLFDDYLCF